MWFGALALPATSVQAQITEIARSAVADVAHLTFGHLCDDTFLLRNDGAQEVRAEVGLHKGAEHTPVPLGAHEQVQFMSKGKEDVELWVNGTLVAKAPKDKRACTEVQGNASVAVAPLDVTTSDGDRRARYANYPYFDPWMIGPFGAWGYGVGGFSRFGVWGPRYTGFGGAPIIVAGGSRGGGRRR
jgi:hypothetical protein